MRESDKGGEKQLYKKKEADRLEVMDCLPSLFYVITDKAWWWSGLSSDIYGRAGP